LEALVTKDSDLVAEALYKRIYERYGPVHSIVSDGGGEFVSHVIRALYQSMGAKHITISPYHLQTNGVTERLNSTLLQYLRVMTEGHAADWANYLGAVQYAYNTAYQTALGATPYLLMYGRHPVDAVDQWLGGIGITTGTIGCQYLE
jgi:transposase InsO family protein